MRCEDRSCEDISCESRIPGISNSDGTISDGCVDGWNTSESCDVCGDCSGDCSSGAEGGKSVCDGGCSLMKLINC